MKVALIFGVGGFVGPYLAKQLKQQDYKVYGTDVIDHLKDESFLDGYFSSNILDSQKVDELITKINPTHIINLAAISSVGQSWKNPGLTMQINVNGTLNILESCLKNNIKPKVLLIGSSEEYIISDKPLDEFAPINANNPYGISKIAQEQFASMYREKYDWDIFCVRAFNHIGVGQRDNFVISSWCKQIAEIEKGEKEPVLSVGNLAVERDFTDVRDIVKAYALVLEKGNSSEIYNIGSGKAVPLKEILDYIVGLSSKKIQVSIDKSLLRPNDNKFICANSDKIKKSLNWNVEHDLFNTIKEIFNSYLKQ